MPTDRLFTGQRLDSTGLYYYGGRYYNPSIGRFISADTFVQLVNGVRIVSSQLTVNAIPAGLGIVYELLNNNPSYSVDSNLIKSLALGLSYPKSMVEVPLNPQALNRYSYVFNNPLKYTDPTGYVNWAVVGILAVAAVLVGALTVFTAGAGLVALGACAAEVTLEIMFAYGTATCFEAMLTFIFAILAWKEATGDTVTDSWDKGIGTPEAQAYTLGKGGPAYTPDNDHPMGDTGFTDWGHDPETGARIISINPPDTYDPSDWYPPY